MTSSSDEQEPKVQSLSTTLGQWRTEHDQYPDAFHDLQAVLMRREDEIAETLRVAGAQFGLFPEIVAEVLTEIGIGTPPDDTTREFIKQNFIARMQWIQQQQQPPGV
jgi:hypothetical protein